MARIKIKDLRSDVMISKEEMKRVFGGITFGKTMTSQTPNFSVLEPDPWENITDSSLSVNMDPIGTRLLKINGI